MKKLKNKQFIIALIFFSLFIAVFVINQFGLFERFTKVEVVIASHKIERDHVISDEDVTTMKIEREYYQDDMYLNKEEVIGKVTTQAINPVEHISFNHFDSGVLRPTPEHEFFPLPDDWLLQIQGTLRRYDLVNITAVFDGEEGVATTVTTTTESTEGIEGTEGNQNLPLITTGGIISDFILKEVPVAFVKSNNNEEVTGATANEDRLQGTDTPSSIELSLTLEQFKQLEKLYADGYKFILSYR